MLHRRTRVIRCQHLTTLHNPAYTHSFCLLFHMHRQRTLRLLPSNEHRPSHCLWVVSGMHRCSTIPWRCQRRYATNKCWCLGTCCYRPPPHNADVVRDSAGLPSDTSPPLPPPVSTTPVPSAEEILSTQVDSVVPVVLAPPSPAQVGPSPAETVASAPATLEKQA